MRVIMAKVASKVSARAAFFLCGMLAYETVAPGTRNLALVLALSVMVATWLLTLNTNRSFTVSGANGGKPKAHVLTLLHD